jgi:26S proteasome regulatory subunit N7
MEIESTKKSSSPSKKKNENVQGSASGENAAPYPKMDLAQSIHRATLMVQDSTSSSDAMMRTLGLSKDYPQQVLTIVREDLKNPSLLRHLMHIFNQKNIETTISEADLKMMQEENEEELKKLEKAIETAKEESGDMEVLDATFEVAKFAAKSLSKEKALEMYDKVLAFPKLSSGKQMDALMECARVASFYGDLVKYQEVLDKISKVANESGDWDRRNRLKIYTALCKLLSRNVKSASSLLIDCIATFSCTEMCPYTEFIVYTMISNVLHLPRTELKQKIIDGPEVLSVKEDASVQLVSTLVQALYDCDYKGYLQAMVDVEPVLLADRFLHAHYGYIMRELHVLGYKQFLDSYKSVTLESMARTFGVSVEFLDVQLSRFIAAGRLTAKIDKFGGVVETDRPDEKNAQYREMIQKGDLLLNRIQKLTRVVDA